MLTMQVTLQKIGNGWIVAVNTVNNEFAMLEYRESINAALDFARARCHEIEGQYRPSGSGVEVTK